jgi:hypothetical protein
MVLRYQGGNFYDLIRNHKKFIWLIYEEIQLDPNSDLTLRPTWIKDWGPIFDFQELFPEIVFVESMYSEVLEEVLELGYSMGKDVIEFGLWDSYNDILKPLIVGFDKGWKKVDSLGKCYCLETLTDIIFEIYPENLLGYLNQPV